MNDQLKDNLCQYLGELMAENEQTFDWIEKGVLTEKINAINLLLGFYTKQLTWMDKFLIASKKYMEAT